MHRPIFCLLATAVLASIAAGCTTPEQPAPSPEPVTHRYPAIGSIERLDPRLDSLIPADARIEKLAEGFDWAEGPVWVPGGEYLLFSDIPPNTIFKWKKGEPISTYMKPSGYTGSEPRGGEPGSNGLLLDADGRLILCEHGDRRVSREDSPGQKTTLADRYQGKRFNSPNDACYHSNGDLYFTDPPYGLVQGMEDPAKELDFQGVYRLKPTGEVQLLTKEMSRPNGIAFSRMKRRSTLPTPTRKRQFGWPLMCRMTAA